MGALEGRIAIVTGAGSGIGRAIARRFSKEGAKVAAMDVAADRVRSVADELPGGDDQVVSVPVDVCDSEQVAAAVQTTVDAFGSLDILVNSAGIWSIRNLRDLEVDEWDRFQNVMVRGPMLFCKYALPHLQKRKGASIVNVGSGGSLVGSKGGPHYGAAKGGVHLFGKSLALQLAQDGIRVNTVCPGPTETGLYDHIGIDQVRGPMEAATPMGRLGTPEEVANAVLFLASDEASFVTGSALLVDGGYTAQ